MVLTIFLDARKCPCGISCQDLQESTISAASVAVHVTISNHDVDEDDLPLIIVIYAAGCSVLILIQSRHRRQRCLSGSIRAIMAISFFHAQLDFLDEPGSGHF